MYGHPRPIFLAPRRRFPRLTSASFAAVSALAALAVGAFFFLPLACR